jgi:hypothetical protein
VYVRFSSNCKRQFFFRAPTSLGCCSSSCAEAPPGQALRWQGAAARSRPPSAPLALLTYSGSAKGHPLLAHYNAKGHPLPAHYNAKGHPLPTHCSAKGHPVPAHYSAMFLS